MSGVLGQRRDGDSAQEELPGTGCEREILFFTHDTFVVDIQIQEYTLLKGYGTCDTEVIKSKRTNQSCILKLVNLQTSFQDTLSDWLRAELTDERGGKMCFSLEGETGKVALLYAQYFLLSLSFIACVVYCPIPPYHTQDSIL